MSNNQRNFKNSQKRNIALMNVIMKNFIRKMCALEK